MVSRSGPHGAAEVPAEVPAEVGVLAVVAFVAELALLGGLAWAGWSLGDGAPASLALALALPLGAAWVWARWCAPRAARRLARLPRWALKSALFAGCTVLLGASAAPAGWVYAGVMLVLFAVSLPADRGR